MPLPTAYDVNEFVAECTEPEAVETNLLQYLIKIQQRFNYIPPVAIETLQQKLDLTSTEIKSVISFYTFLSLDYQGEYHILFSDNITDRMGDNQGLYQQLKQALKGQAVTIGFTSCTGLSDQGPGLLVNGMAIKQVNKKRINQIAQLIKHRKSLAEWPAHLFDIKDNIRRRDRQLSMHSANGDGLRILLEKGNDWFINTLDESGLRGRGGAGFKTASKWKYCLNSEADTHYVICNADEGEPGTFKDRVLLHSYAHSVIEGMTLCARVIHANQGFIYLRAEYRYLLKHLQEVLQQCRDSNLLGQGILGEKGFDFDIEIHLGAGAYICGEESALIESLEGKRGIPRIRPPFPVVEGYNNKPTVVNNVETFWSVSRIILKGSDWFRQAGTEQSSGTRLLSISGDCLHPGVYEYPFGTRLRQILEDCGGLDAQAVQMSGAAGNMILSKDFDRTMSFEDLSTGGSFMVIGPERDLMDVLENFAQFFKHESCGFCTPCRIGTSLIVDIIQRFRSGLANKAELKKLRDLLSLMQQTSFCGLGCSAPSVFLNALDESPKIFEDLIKTESDNPVFDLEAATSEFRQFAEHGFKES